MAPSGYPRSIRYTFFLLGIILSLYGIIKAKEFLYPVVFGALLAYLLFPVSNYLEKKSVPRILSILIAEVVGIALIYGAGLILLRQFSNIIDEFPVLKKQAISNINFFLGSIEDVFGIADNKLESGLKNSVEHLFMAGRESFNQIFVNLAGTIIKIGLLPVYIFLFLYYRTKFAYFVLKMLPKERHLITLKVLRQIATVATRYMGGMFIVVSILAVVDSAGLSLIGLKYPVLIGITVSLFSFIPYFGNLIGGSIAVLFSLLTMDSYIYGVEVAGMFILVHLIENNILSPNIVGESVELNPFFIIIGLIAAAMIWGIPGMLVIMPMLAITKIICDNVPALTPFGYLLGPKGTRRHALTAENIRRFGSRVKRMFNRA